MTIALCAIVALMAGQAFAANAGFDSVLRPALKQHCVKCHGDQKVKGKVNLFEIKRGDQLLAKPDLIKDMVEALDARDMPPVTEPKLDDKKRDAMVKTLRAMLRQAVAGKQAERVRVRRLNRFQYNNSIRDLFRLNRDVFQLSEKLMTRQSNYVSSGAGRMPDNVLATSRSLEKTGGMRGVEPFPKDLRAQHGFDNQADQLTLSPLLLEAFLRLAVSIVDSPDFNQDNVGVWNDLFAPPSKDADIKRVFESRLRPFLVKTFRGPVDDATLRRYVAFGLAKMRQGLTFTQSMKKAVSAVLSSPKFLYRVSGTHGPQYELASRLSFFLWGSCPDDELLALAERGELAKRDVIGRTVDRMLADPKVERFLDAFPSQWMQLETLFGAAPDPMLSEYYRLDKERPASVQMVLEPLLLFDAVFVEDRPIVELIKPSFAYRSDFLSDWYTTDLQPPKFDVEGVLAVNRQNDARRASLQGTIRDRQAKVEAIVKPVRERLLAERKQAFERDGRKPVDLKPLAAWEFDGDLKASVGNLDLKAHGKVTFENGMVVLKRAFLQSTPLQIDLKAKSMEVWIALDDVAQRGGGAMTVQGPGDFFDSIVLGERKPRHWISGSNGFSRTLDFPESTPESAQKDARLHLVMVYDEDGTTRLYRNGMPYGKPFRKGRAVFPKGKTSILFGLRHLPAGGNKYLSVRIDRARLYDRALTAEEVAASAGNAHLYVSNDDLRNALTPEQRAESDKLAEGIKADEAALKNVPGPIDPNKRKQELRKRFENDLIAKVRSNRFNRVTLDDPRYGGVITNAAMLTMTSSPKRTLPIARGAWIIEVVLNDPPPPPPNDVPPLNEDSGPKNLTIRERFAEHRSNPDCAGCHSRIDPLGFAMENYDVTGRWRDKYANGRDVDASGKLMKKHDFAGAVEFKSALVKERRRFATAFTAHLLRFALARELGPADSLAVEKIVESTSRNDHRLRGIIRQVVFSEPFLRK